MVRQVVPGVRPAQTAPLPVVGVRGQPVVPAPLNVDGRQVEGDGVGHLEEPLGQLLAHDLVGGELLGGRGEEAAEDGIDAPLLHQTPRTEYDAMLVFQESSSLFFSDINFRETGNAREDQGVRLCEIHRIASLKKALLSGKFPSAMGEKSVPSRRSSGLIMV